MTTSALTYIEQCLFELAQMRLAQIWEGKGVPKWNDIGRVVAALNSMEDFQLEPKYRARVDDALDRIYEPARYRLGSR